MTYEFLNDTHIELIKQIFLNEIDESPVDIKRFRIKHSKHLSLLDFLETKNFIISNDGQYSSKLESVNLIVELEPIAKEYIDKAKELFDLLNQEYRDNPDVVLSLEHLKSKLGYSRDVINRLIRLMITAPILGGWTTEVEADDATVSLNESILRYESLDRLLESIRGWRSPVTTLGINEPTFSKPSPLDDFSFLLHPQIIKASLSLYQSGHLREAVLNSMTAVFDSIRQKTGLLDDGDRLVSKAFSLEMPYLIFSEIHTESGQSDQKGFMQIFRGAYQGVRNPKAHTLEHDLTALKAAQYLVFASLMMRRVDESVLVAVEIKSTN